MRLYFCIFLLLLTSCASQKNIDQDSAPEVLVDLANSTKIIQTMMARKTLGTLLEDPEQLDLLINNFSPAQIAFEAEVLSTEIPLVVIYYFKDGSKQQEFIKQLNQLAIEHSRIVN